VELQECCFGLCLYGIVVLYLQMAVRQEACSGLYKLSLSGLEGGESINRSFLLLAASTLLKFLPDAQALKPLRVSANTDRVYVPVLFDYL